MATNPDQVKQARVRPRQRRPIAAVSRWFLRQRPAFGLTAPYIALISVVGFAAVTAHIRGAGIDEVVRDVAEVVGAPVYTGFLSQVGLFLWSAGAAICFVSYLSIRSREPTLRARYLFSSGILTTILLIDDAFLVHDRLVPALFGIPPAATYAGYAVVLAAYLWRFRRPILVEPHLLLVMAIGLGGVAAVLDVLDGGNLSAVFPSNALKFLAVGTWVLYFADYCVRVITRRSVA